MKLKKNVVTFAYQEDVRGQLLREQVFVPTFQVVLHESHIQLAVQMPVYVFALVWLSGLEFAAVRIRVLFL